MSTNDNLGAAFAGESQANRKYLAFAKAAEQENLPNIARLFRAAAEAETVHAHAHLRVMGGIGDTKENLQVAIEGEGYEYESMYPKFVEEAKKEDNKGAVMSFSNAMAVEKIHHDLYGRALEQLKAGRDVPGDAIFVCPVCGNTVYRSAPDRCPICGTEGKKFINIK